MELTNETFAPLRVMIDEFVRLGVRHAVAAPGSRNAPISYALSDRDEIRTWSVLDERSAGFFALGLAKSTRTPVVVTCSSGTAAANLHPAVIEASHAGVPLILLTADRPPELRDVGAGQAIDQVKLFGSSVRWFVEAGNHPLSEQTLRHFRALACRAWSEATAADPGPVHVNLPLRDPLFPERQPLGELEKTTAAAGRASGRPWTTSVGTPSQFDGLAAVLATAQRPLIVAGEQHQPGLAAAIAGFAGAASIPVLADALSQLRREPFAHEATIVSAYDLILRDAAARENLSPDLIIRVGEMPTSRPLRDWLGGRACEQIVIDPRGVWHEPSRVATQVWRVDPLTVFKSGSPPDPQSRIGAAWPRVWRLLETATQSAIEHALSEEPFPFEPAVYRSIIGGLRSGATVFVSSSMPVRDVESFVAPGRDDVRFLANRGANGIDGVVSTALGVAASYDCDRVVLLSGDLAVLYDIGALAIARRHGIEITIVCVDNGGGGIFSFLPIADHTEHFEDKIAAPSHVDLQAVAEAFGMAYSAPVDAAALAEAVEAPGFVHLRAERTE
ncbi:MAG: 2-succinyl-5-enolpyruvyl-6-hydroxy-3-cyclohexene-1-carboxylic-acid synthase, partial [Solirubrobacterales bacterium]